MNYEHIDPVYTKDFVVRLFKRIKFPFDGSTLCWEWIGVKSKGYGVKFVRQSRYRKSHRIMWELHNNKKIPPGLVICHTCDHPWCVNPYHLVAGTQMENMAQRNRNKRDHASKQYNKCKHGHSLIGENASVDRMGHRKCKACARNRRKASPS